MTTKAVPAPQQAPHPIRETFRLEGDEDTALRVGLSMLDGRPCLQLKRGDVREVTVVFDGDEAGRVSVALAAAYEHARQAGRV